MRRLTTRLLAPALIAAATAAGAQAQILQATPATVPLTLQHGANKLTDHSVAYVPKSVTGSAPLLVLLTGGGLKADDFLRDFTSEAEKRGIVLLAIGPAGGSWTLKPGAAGAADFGTDPAAIDAALKALFARAPIDPNRTAILGFSDGGSYALSLGLTNPKLFRAVAAMSPSAAWVGGKLDPSQKLFIAHGRDDQTVPIANTRDRIVPGLEAAGLKPRTRWFSGRHELERRSVLQALDFLFPGR